MKLPPCNSHLRSHSRTGRLRFRPHRRQGIDPKFFDSWSRNGRTLSEAPRREIPTEARRLDAGALSIGPFEGSRWRLRRTRSGYGYSMASWRLGMIVRQACRCGAGFRGFVAQVQTRPGRAKQRLQSAVWAAILRRKHTSSGRAVRPAPSKHPGD